MNTIQTLEELQALYGPPVPNSLTKVVPRLTPLYRRWIGAARFCVLATVGPDGTDASPRGDDGPVVRIVDDETLWLPDWRGNNRTDSLTNIVQDGRVSLMFMVRGSDNVVRVNGRAVLTADPAVTETFAQNGRYPRAVVAIRVAEAYFQCAKALMRSGLWRQPQVPDLPTAGAFLAERDADFDGQGYDAGYAQTAQARMW